MPRRRELPPAFPDHSAARRPPGRDALYRRSAARAPYLRCADKDDDRSADRGREREWPAHREYDAPDAPAGGEGRKTGRRVSVALVPVSLPTQAVLAVF